jgi:hypothetical protein
MALSQLLESLRAADSVEMVRRVLERILQDPISRDGVP